MVTFTTENLKENARKWLFGRDLFPKGIHQDWLLYLSQIAAHIISDDPYEFVNWHVIKLTIFTDDHAVITPKQLDFFRAMPDWESRLVPALVESPVGNPKFSRLHPTSSGGQLRQAYVLLRCEIEFGCKTDDMDLIVEFGGGYGAMALLAHKLNFSGRYLIIDNEPMSSLQCWYLSQNNVPTHYGKPLGSESGVYFVSPENIDPITQQVISAERSMFIANWSLSETPLDLRKRMMKWLRSCEFDVLGITYQGDFVVNNAEFFTAESAAFLDAYQLSVKPFVSGLNPEDYFSRHRMMFLKKLD